MTVRHDVENLVGTVAQMVSVEVDVVEAVETAEAAEAAETAEAVSGVVAERNAQPTAVVEIETERFDEVVPDEVVVGAVGCSVVQIDVNLDCP
jgi:hypothetical protein